MVQRVTLRTCPPGVVLVELVNWGVIMDGDGQVRTGASLEVLVYSTCYTQGMPNC